MDNLKADKDNSFGVWPLMTDTLSTPIYTVGPDAPVQTWHDRWSFEECFNTGDGPPPHLLDALSAVPTLPGMLTSLGTLGNPAARTIARAMQEYGLILTDKSDALITQAEDPRPYMMENGGLNPYDALFGGVEWHSILNEIPVDRLQALPFDYGRPHCRWVLRRCPHG